MRISRQLTVVPASLFTRLANLAKQNSDSRIRWPQSRVAIWRRSTEVLVLQVSVDSPQHSGLSKLVRHVTTHLYR